MSLISFQSLKVIASEGILYKAFMTKNQSIFSSWLVISGYLLFHRILGDKIIYIIIIIVIVVIIINIIMKTITQLINNKPGHSHRCQETTSRRGKPIKIISSSRLQLFSHYPCRTQQC